MCDQATAKQILDTIHELMDEGKMFTAFDVTKLVRNGGHQVRHHEVRTEVHRLFDNDVMDSQYDRVQHTFNSNGSPVTAFVFMRDSDDVLDYDPDLFGNQQLAPPQPGMLKTPSQGILPANPTVAQPPTAPQTDPTDARGRLCVSNSLTRKLGWSPGDYVVIARLPKMGGISMKLQRMSCSKAIGTTYQIDKDGNVRIGQAAMKSFGFVTSKGVSFVIDRANILVSPK